MIRFFFLAATFLMTPGLLNAQRSDAQAELMLLYQRSYGGWPKAIGNAKVDYTKPLTADEKTALRKTADATDGTIDNNATTREITHLLKAYAATTNEAYLDAAKRGIDYLFKAQYANGGWPQFYPDTRGYRTQVTFNDNAIANVLNLMFEISRQKDVYAALGADYGGKAAASLERGIALILKTQFVFKGTKTAWAAQYDHVTLTPAKARAFELPSLASAESAGILKLLMRLPQPSDSVRQAIQAGMAWFDAVKIEGFAAVRVDASKEPEEEDVLLQRSPGSVIWARFYDLDDMKPMFVGRDGILRRNLSEIDNERRTGYAWYGTWGTSLQNAYMKWKVKHKIN